MKILNKIIKKYRALPVAAKATLWFLLCTVLQKGVAMLTTPIFTRLMPPEQYGQVNVYNSWLQTLTIVTTLRLNWGVFNKGMSKFPSSGERDAYTSTMQTITMVLAVVAFVFYWIFRDTINAITELPTFVMCGIFAELMVSPAIDFWTLRKRYDFLYKPVVFRTLLVTLFHTVLGVLAVVVTEEKGYGRILSLIFVNFAFGAVLFYKNIKSGKTFFVWKYAKFAILFNLPLLIHYLFQYVLAHFDRIMIQKMVGFATAGIYGVAQSAGSMIGILTQSINNSFIPWEYKKLEEKKYGELGRVIYLILMLVGAVIVMMCAVAPEVMKIMADSRYYSGVYVIPPVAMGIFFSFMYTIFAQIEFYYDANKFSMFASGIGAILNIILNMYGIRYFGYVAAAYTTLICYAINCILHYGYLQIVLRKKGIADPIFHMGPLALLSASVVLCGLLMVQMYEHTFVRYGIVAAVCVIGCLNSKKILGILKTIMNRRR